MCSPFIITICFFLAHFGPRWSAQRSAQDGSKNFSGAQPSRQVIGSPFSSFSFWILGRRTQNAVAKTSTCHDLFPIPVNFSIILLYLLPFPLRGEILLRSGTTVSATAGSAGLPVSCALLLCCFSSCSVVKPRSHLSHLKRQKNLDQYAETCPL